MRCLLHNWQDLLIQRGILLRVKTRTHCDAFDSCCVWRNSIPRKEPAIKNAQTSDKWIDDVWVLYRPSNAAEPRKSNCAAVSVFGMSSHLWTLCFLTLSCDKIEPCQHWNRPAENAFNLWLHCNSRRHQKANYSARIGSGQLLFLHTQKNTRTLIPTSRNLKCNSSVINPLHYKKKTIVSPGSWFCTRDWIIKTISDLGTGLQILKPHHK